MLHTDVAAAELSARQVSTRLLLWSGALLVSEAVVFAALFGSKHGLDFVSFYAAGRLADAGHAALAYDPVAHGAAEWAATEPGIGYQFFYYPPVFLLLAAPLARLPYPLAYLVFEVGTLALYLAALQPILQARDRRWLIPALAFPAVFWTIGLGQNAFLSAALFGFATSLIDRRPTLAGAILGALIYKPHLGVLIPVALLAGRRWTALAGAAAGTGTLIAVSALLFGVPAWTAFLEVFRGAHSTYENGRIELAGMVSVFGAARLLGVATGYAYVAQGVSAVTAAACVAYVWWRGASLPLRAAALIAGTLLAVPVLLLYDLMLLAVAGAWLIADIEARGPRPGEAPIIAAGFMTPLFCLEAGYALHLPFAPIVSAAAMFAVVRRSFSAPAAGPVAPG
jgi:hypothetical protein